MTVITMKKNMKIMMITENYQQMDMMTMRQRERVTTMMTRTITSLTTTQGTLYLIAHIMI